MRSFLGSVELGVNSSSSFIMSRLTPPCSGLVVNLYLLLLLPMIPRISSAAESLIPILLTKEQISRKIALLLSSFVSLLLTTLIDIDLLRCFLVCCAGFPSLEYCLDVVSCNSSLWCALL